MLRDLFNVILNSLKITKPQQLGSFRPLSHCTGKCERGPSIIRYPVSYNRILNCEGVAPSYIKADETAMG